MKLKPLFYVAVSMNQLTHDFRTAFTSILTLRKRMYVLSLPPNLSLAPSPQIIVRIGYVFIRQ